MTKKRQKKSKRYVPTDGPTDRQADRVGHRVACTRLKTYKSMFLHLSVPNFTNRLQEVKRESAIEDNL